MRTGWAAWRRRAVAVGVGVLAGVVPAGASAGAAAAGRQGGDEAFVPLADVVGRPLSGAVLFLPLAPEFETCLPLTGPCPEGSASLVLVTAERRRVAWTPDAADLPRAAVAAGATRPVGSPPPDADGARYLLPVLDGGAAALRYVPTRLEDGSLVAEDADAGAAGGTEGRGDAAVPVLSGPVLPAGSPQGLASERIVEAPRSVDADALQDAVPVLLVRRAAPSRVVFGVGVDPAWGLDGVEYLPLVSDAGVARLARHEGRVGLAVAAPEDVDVPADGGSGSGGDGSNGGGSGDGVGGDDGGGPGAGLVAAGAAVAALVIAGLAVLARRRGRGRAAGGAPPGRRPVV